MAPRRRIAILRRLLLLFVSGAALTAQPQSRAAPPTQTGPRVPSLVVLLVVDQMRADYVDRFEADWTRGLGRLAREGARFVNAAYPYLNTFTCAGHSTIGTGTFPHRHGNFQNTWFDRRAKALVACADDARVRTLSYSGGTKAGLGPGRLLERTFADVLREQRRARIVTLSLKARSAIMMAGHGGHAVTWLGEAPEGWETSTAFTTVPVPSVQAFVDSRPMAADFGKVWDRLLPLSRYADPDDGLAEQALAGWTTTFPHPLVGLHNRPDGTFRAQWEASPFGDEYLGNLAAHLVETERLGHQGTTDMLAVSFSSPDLVGHRFGPRSQEVQDMYARLDRTIGTLFDRLDAALGRDRYVVALTADHGVAEIPEQAKLRGDDAGRLAAQTLRETVERVARQALGPGRYVAYVNSNDIYFEPGVYDTLRANRKTLDAIVGALASQPGIARVFRSDELLRVRDAMDPLLKAAALSYARGRSGDLVIALAPGYILSTIPTTHGSASAYDQRVPLIFLGAGITPGRRLEAATPADIAPTLADIVGLGLNRAEGRSLRALLYGEPSATRAPRGGRGRAAKRKK